MILGIIIIIIIIIIIVATVDSLANSLYETSTPPSNGHR